MPILILMLLLSMAECTFHDKDVHALTIEEAKPYSKNQRIDFGIRDQIKAFVCAHIDCPQNVGVDEFKMHGTQFAALRVRIHYNF